MADEIRLIDANDYRKRRCRTCINRVQCDNGGNLCFDIMVLNTCPTIEAQPVNTDKCKALRNIEGIRLILSNVYNTGSTLQDCDYDAIYKRLDVIENILKGK